MQKSNGEAPIYISYAWGSESEATAEAIEAEFQKRGLSIIRDKNHLGYKGRIKDFMEQIGRSKYVILVISDKYLHSINCMFELVQIFKNQHFYERIFPVVLDEVNIADPSERVKLIKYWENETESLSNEIKQLKDLSNIQGLTDDLNLNAEIRDNIARLTDILKDTNTLSLDKLIGSNFEPLYKAIHKKIRSDSALGAAGTTGDSVTKEDVLESKKKNNIKIAKRLVIAIALVVLVIMGFRAIWDSPPVDEEKEQFDSLDLFDGRKDALKVLDEKIEDTIKINEISEEETTPLSNIKYDVDLVVPSQMAQAEVFVDGKPAEIVERGLISITVRIRKKETSHHFEIRSNGDRCFTDKLVVNDNIKLTLCN